jgi:hypothetical protein
MKRNEDIKDTLHQLLMDFKDMKKLLFDIIVTQEVIVAPIREYIKNWLKKALIKIIESYQEEAISTSQVVPMKESIKHIPTNK